MKQCTICGYIKPIHFLRRYRVCDDCFLDDKWNKGELRHDDLENSNWYVDKMLNAFSHGYLYLEDYYNQK
jgi:hypothetical protein